MKTFYIFEVNNMFKTKYNTKNDALYKTFYKIYQKCDIDLYRKVVKKINQKHLNDFILSKHLDEFYYYKKNNIHMIDNAFEKSIITINNYYIKIESDKIMNSFVRDLLELNVELFIIDFSNKDYCFLSDDIRSNVLI